MIFSTLVFIAAILILLTRRRNTKLREQLIQQENNELKNTMELRNQELVSKALMVSNINEQFESFHNNIQNIFDTLDPNTAHQLKNMIKELESSLPGQAWHEFETRFEHVHQGFFSKLLQDYPSLSPTELKLCSLLRLNMNTKDMALLTNRSIGTIDNIRSNIRKTESAKR